jgi:quaternary ammonium compound-resistance protein SugE
MAWLILIAAGAMEIIMAAALKSSQGWTRPIPSLIGSVAAIASMFLLTHALRTLPIGVAYAIWTGIGAVGVALLGIIAYCESASIPRLACITLILCGIVGLRMIEK